MTDIMQNWTRCSDHEPPVEGDYLVTVLNIYDKYRYMEVQHYVPPKYIVPHSGWMDEEIYRRVIAWQECDTEYEGQV